MVACVQLTHFSSRWLKGYIYSSFYYHHQIGSIHPSHCYHIFPWLCAWDICYIIFCHLLHIRSGKTGNLFSLVLCSLWWVQIFGYVLAYPLYIMWGCIFFSLPISLVMIERINILCLIIIIKSEVWTITHCLGLGHETVVSAVCLTLLLWH